MNNFNIVGKIQKCFMPSQEVAFITILVKRDKDNAEFIEVTTFNTMFAAKYLRPGKWIACTGHIHINKHNKEYKTELIADQFFFVGDLTDDDRAFNEIYANQ